MSQNDGKTDQNQGAMEVLVKIKQNYYILY